MLTEPCPREIMWGGTRLYEKYGKKAPFSRIAETYEISLLPEASCRIANGEYAGQTLSEYLGDGACDFPLLIKLIDSEMCLSVQVHPKKNGALSGKSELWYILDAEPNSWIAYGVKVGVTKDIIKEKLLSGELSELLNIIPVKRGDVFYIPEGQLHCLGGGITLAEFQESCDITYRLYDFNRKDKDGKLRPLHIEEGLSALTLRTESEIERLRYEKGYSENCICKSRAFTVNKLSVKKRETLYFKVHTALVCVEGEGILFYEGTSLPVRKGSTLFIPHGTKEFTVEGNLTLLSATV